MSLRRTPRRNAKVKQESEIQTFINEFNQEEIEGVDETVGTSKDTTDEIEQIIVKEGDVESEEYKFVFIVEDEEDADDKDEEVYEFDEIEESEDKLKPLVSKKSSAQAQASSSQIHVCSYCNYSTPKRYLLARHMKCHSEDRPHKCDVCERGFKTIASLTNHHNTHTGRKPHACKYCESAFTTSGELVRHVRYRHTHEKPHKCPECDYASVELSKLKRHIRCHTGERPYQCPHCTYASPDTFKLKRHLRIHTGEKPYQCDICNARFTQSNSLKAHKLIHSVGEKPVFQCELCPTTCGRKTDLRIHIQKLHTSDVPIKCKRCPEEFPDRYSYKIHAKTHEGEKCYKCEICPYASISARHLDSHMLVHTDQKPFQCSFCEQTFRQKQLLKRHENIYHNPNYVATQPKEKTHFCPTCTKGFRHKGNLMRHMTTHDMKKKVYMKEEGNNEEGDYVVFEVIQDGQDEEIYEGEESEGEVQQDGAEDGNYILAENIDADDIIIKASPKGAGTSSITFGFSDDEEDEGIKN